MRTVSQTTFFEVFFKHSTRGSRTVQFRDCRKSLLLMIVAVYGSVLLTFLSLELAASLVSTGFGAGLRIFRQFSRMSTREAL